MQSETPRRGVKPDKLLDPEGYKNWRRKKSQYSGSKGSKFESKVLELLARYFQVDQDLFFVKGAERSHQHAGDIRAMGELASVFPHPVECKDRMTWKWKLIFERPINCELHKFWLKALDDFGAYGEPIVVFTRNYDANYVFTRVPPKVVPGVISTPVVRLHVPIYDEMFYIELLTDFLLNRFPLPMSPKNS